ncbi:MAG: hypothetical protein ABFD89_08785, partial [Bryobacteraceae bacterium]
MSINLGSALLYFQGDRKGLDKALKEAKADVKEAFDGMAAIGKTAMQGLVGAGLGFAAFGASAVKAASESEAKMAQLDAVLKSMKGSSGMAKEEILGLADSLKKMTSYDDDVIIGAETMLLTFGNIGKETFPAATQAVLDMATKMSGGTASMEELKTTSIQVGKALNDPINGVSALAKVGVTFTEQQKATIKGLLGTNEELAKLGKEAGAAYSGMSKLEGQLAIANQKLAEMTREGKASASSVMSQRMQIVELREKIKSGKDAIEEYSTAARAQNTTMSEGQRMAAAQKIVIDELAREFGGSASAQAGTFRGQLEKIAIEFGDIQEAIGFRLIPILQDLWKRWLEPLMLWIQEWVESGGLSRFMDEFARVLKDEVVPWVERMAWGVYDILTYLGLTPPKIGQAEEATAAWYLAWLPIASIGSALALLIFPAIFSALTFLCSGGGLLLLSLGLAAGGVYLAFQAIHGLVTGDWKTSNGFYEWATGLINMTAPLDALFSAIYEGAMVTWDLMGVLGAVLSFDFSQASTQFDNLTASVRRFIDSLKELAFQYSPQRMVDWFNGVKRQSPNQQSSSGIYQPPDILTGGLGNLSISNSFGNVYVRNQGDVDRLAGAISRRTVESLRMRG